MKNFLAILTISTTIMAATNAFAQTNDYYKCVNSSNNLDDGHAKCYMEETNRDISRIETLYKRLSSDARFSKWNNGNGLFKGNFKDMLDTWVSYRNRFCSLYAEVYSAYDGSSYSFHQADCMMKMTRQHANEMEDLWQTSFSKIEG